MARFNEKTQTIDYDSDEDMPPYRLSIEIDRLLLRRESLTENEIIRLERMTLLLGGFISDMERVPKKSHLRIAHPRCGE